MSMCLVIGTSTLLVETASEGSGTQSVTGSEAKKIMHCSSWQWGPRDVAHPTGQLLATSFVKAITLN